MEYIIGIGAFLAIFIVLIVKDKIRQKKELYTRLRDEFGKLDVSECSKEELSKLKKSLQYYNDLIPEHVYEDFNIDDVFLKIDNSLSSIGEEYLYYSLHNPYVGENILKQRDEVSDDFLDGESTIDLRYKLLSIKKYKKITALECIYKLKSVDTNDTVKHVVMLMLFIASFVLMFTVPTIGVFLCLMVATINSVSYIAKKSKIEEYVDAAMVLVMMIDTAGRINTDSVQGLNKGHAYDLLRNINDYSKKFNDFKKNAWLIAPKSSVESIIEILLDYLKFITHIDIIKFNVSVKRLKRYESELLELYKLFGELELALNIASVKNALSYYCKPDFDSLVAIDSSDMYHPLINNPVCNNCNTEKSMLITGSNASGKSTYLRMLGVNVLLAQTLSIVCAKSYKAPLFNLASSMKVTDSILDGESFYMAEIRHIKEILDYKSERPLFICIDEILRGTNTLERVAASTEILKYMAGKNTLVIAATHDIELVELLKGIYDNYYFCENIDDSENIFDYKINKGVNYTNNAIKLLGRCGYPDSIVESSFRLCDELKRK